MARSGRVLASVKQQPDVREPAGDKGRVVSDDDDVKDDNYYGSFQSSEYLSLN